MKQETTEQQASPKKLSTVKGVLVALMWTLLWPIAIFGACIPIFTIASALAGNPMQLGTFFGVISASLVGLCLILIKLFRKSRAYHPVRGVGASILSIYTALGSLVLIVMIFGTINNMSQNTTNMDNPNSQVAGTVIAPSLMRDADIDQALHQVGATDAKIAKFSTEYVDSYAAEGQWGLYQTYINPTTGKFLYGKMTILKGLNQNDYLSSVAHEYLHHVWFALMDEPTKTKLTSDLIAMYGNDSPVRSRAKWYSDEQKLQPTELFSIYCTESTDGYLTGYVRSECEKYINRNAFLMLR